MSFLSDHTIEACIKSGRIKIEPWDPARLQPASVDLTLDRFFKVPIFPLKHEVDPRVEQQYTEHDAMGGGYVLPAHGFCLGSTIERITLPADVIGRLEGKSSLGRLGLTAHITAGFFDPGFDGHATLELYNANTVPIILYPGMPICQMSFARLTTAARNPYGSSALKSKYQHQPPGPKGSLYHENFET